MYRVKQSGRYGAARRGERGAVSIIVAVSLVALIGFVGLALDLGKLYVAKSELQNSADACALAAARDLTGATVNLSVPEAAGITAGHLNYALFQSGAVQMTTDSSVLFSDSLSNPFLPKSSVASPASIKYAKCTTSKTNIAHWFIQVLGAFTGATIANATVSATAVATVGAAQTTCAIPVFICKPGTETTPPTAGASYTIGKWLASKSGSSPASGAGNFGWAALDGSSSASEIKNELTGNYCSLPAVGANIGSTGNKVADSGAWNTRFGIYGTSYKGPQDGAPDFTGYAYTATNTSPPQDAYGDFVGKRNTFQSYQGDTLSKIDTKGSYSAGNYPLGADRRLALAPELDCGTLASSHQAPVITWDCVLMLDPMESGGGAGPVHLEYRGSSSAPGSPCATQGVPGSGSAVGPQVPVLLQ
ncbi:MAG TPA: pilus assembly protein TadG-related protein [Paraburkholderia sp.]|nr:pilus assembly protein TadG-related protein [Paraburkholderia sp.]